MFLDATPVIYTSIHHVRRKTVYIFICTIMHLYMKGTAQGISAIHPSGSFELSIYPRVYGCQATNASPLALVITNRFVIVLWYKSPYSFLPVVV